MSPPDTPNARFAATELGGPPSATAARTAGSPITPLSAANPSSLAEVGPPDDLLGTTLRETYVIERVLGEGGMGRVYLASHTRINNKRFAVKTLHPELLRNKEAVARFFREAEAAALIPSPNVVGVVDVDRAPDGRPFIVNEYLDGQDLAERLRAMGGKLPIDGAVSIVRQVCRGLAAAHACGIVHRDIKPENVFLVGMTHPVAKVLDFGISRLDEPDSASLTKTGSILGTPAYMAPEQARGEHVDARTDIYAVGALLYATVTGQVPFARDNPSAMLAAVLLEEPTRPRTLVPAIPDALEAVIQRAMAKRADERYATVQELDRALAPFDTTSEENARAGFPDAAASGASGAARASAEHSEDEARSMRQARPALMILMIAGLGTFLAGLLIAIEGAMRLGEIELSGLQIVMLLGGLAATLATPIWLLIRHVRRDVWSNVLRVMGLARTIREPLLTGFVAVGATAMLMRFVEAVLLGRIAGAAWPLWDVVLFGIWMVAAVVTFVRGRWSGSRDGTSSSAFALAPFLVGALSIGAVVLGLSLGRDDLQIVSSEGPREEEERDGRASGVLAEEGSGGAPGDLEEAKGDSDPAKIAKLRRTVIDRGEALVFGEALDAAQKLFELSPKADEDLAVRKVISEAALQPGDVGARAVHLMAYSMGSTGVDMLFELSLKPTTQQVEVKRLLAQSDVRAHGTPALRIAYDLDKAKGCQGKVPLLPQAERHGDARSAKLLRPLTFGRSRGCGVLGLGSCGPPCGAANTAKIRQALAAIDARSAKKK